MFINLPDLQKSCFIARHQRYQLECVIDQRVHAKALMNLLMNIPACEILGTEFYLSARRSEYKISYLAEFAEVDAGHFIYLNSKNILKLVLEALSHQRFHELKGFFPTHGYKIHGVMTPEDLKIELYDHHLKSNLLIIQPIVSVDLEGNGYFPHEILPWTLDFLIDAIAQARNGRNATLLFLGLHSGIRTIYPANHIDAEYYRLLQEAYRSGVKSMAAAIKVINKNQVIIEIDNINHQTNYLPEPTQSIYQSKHNDGKNDHK